jgi:hypothetical protein
VRQCQQELHRVKKVSAVRCGVKSSGTNHMHTCVYRPPATALPSDLVWTAWMVKKSSHLYAWQWLHGLDMPIMWGTGQI